MRERDRIERAPKGDVCPGWRMRNPAYDLCRM
jgi:hypothetical protein